MKNWYCVIVLFCLVFPVHGISAGEAAASQLQSPDSKFNLYFRVKKGRPVYSVDWKGKPLVVESGLKLDIEGWASAGFEIVNTSKDKHDETWAPVCGDRAKVRDYYNELTVELKDIKSARRLNITFRAYNEGVAFRYTVPTQKGAEKITIRAEGSEFRFPANHNAWQTTSAQGRYGRVPVSKIKSGCERPLVIQASDDCYIALGEAMLINHARMKFAAIPKVTGVVSRLEGKVNLGLPAVTPWRFIMAAESPGKLLENNFIVSNLNDPCALSDTSWIKPGKVLREITLTTAGGRACVDFAVKHNIQYILFDAGWYGLEYSKASDASTVTLDPKRSKGPLDLPAVIDYGKKRGVGVILYVNYIALRKQLDQILPLYKKWGIKGVKYGFVGVGTQDHVSFVSAAIRKAAENELMINIHDERRPTGYSRTYPNLMTLEGIRGDEVKDRDTRQLLAILFTRCLAGPADNTFCYYDSRVDRISSHAQQLAKIVCLYSPWQYVYWYDRPADIKDGKRVGPEDSFTIGNEPELVFWDHVPTSWDETKVLAGRIGEYAVIARRAGSKWFIGCISASKPRDLKVPLAFLDQGKTYNASIYVDDESVKTRTRVRVDTKTVNSSDVLVLKVKANGGAAIEISP